MPSDGGSRAGEIEAALRAGRVPGMVAARLEAAREGRAPWVATLTPAELLLARSHGLRPVAAIVATCWMHYGWSWTEGHAQGWHGALGRLKQEAKAAGANAVLDVKLRTIPVRFEHSMDFSLVGTAVRVEGLAASADPVVATVPALEFVKLLEAGIVPTGIAVGAQYEWLNDWRGQANKVFSGNVETVVLSEFWERIRQRAHAELRRNAEGQGNGVLAHVHFGQMFKVERDKQPTRYLGRQIVVATVVDAPKAVVPHAVGLAVDMHAGRTPLVGRARHHQSYGTVEGEGEGAI